MTVNARVLQRMVAKGGEIWLTNKEGDRVDIHLIEMRQNQEPEGYISIHVTGLVVDTHESVMRALPEDREHLKDSIYRPKPPRPKKPKMKKAKPKPSFMDELKKI